jgi:serine/threonine protein kinase
VPTPPISPLASRDSLTQAPIRILHLDLKSLNVLVCSDEYGDVLLKICDFGSSRQVSVSAANALAVPTYQSRIEK